MPLRWQSAFFSVPVAVFLALLLPGSKVLPLGDLTFIVFFSMWAAALCKGDLVKSFLTTTVFIIIAIYAGSYTAPVMNQIAQASGLLPAEQAGNMVTHFANGFYPHSLVATLLGSLAWRRIKPDINKISCIKMMSLPAFEWGKLIFVKWVIEPEIL